ncbi:hypothetical protein [Rhodopseudomonas palustris]|uniref:hypothetical protein n=1 Tax=Rhodopseudomonas palustris TaxID=1076 RepID=UPI0005C92F93|nr:hypothetical protein [Rhodopseudomonas palustris]MDF3812581.1 hypothetical protein [Rhodopseudomonas sp. BAL398]
MFKSLSGGRFGDVLKVRSSGRNFQTDAARIGSIARSIETALQTSRIELNGLNRRLNDVIARTAVTIGNDTDEYLDREPTNTGLQNRLNREIADGEQRLRELETNIDHFNSLKAVLATRFPDHADTIAAVEHQR